jgi:hypothetical protein
MSTVRSVKPAVSDGGKACHEPALASGYTQAQLQHQECKATADKQKASANSNYTDCHVFLAVNHSCMLLGCLLQQVRLLCL